MTTTPALFSSTASAAAPGASAAKAADAANAGEKTTFATVLAKTTSEGSATPQAGTAAAGGAPTANAANVAAQLAGAASTGDAATADGEAETTDAVTSPDPTVLIAGTATQQTAPTTLAMPAMSAVLIAEGAPEADAAVDAAIPAAGAATPSATASQAPATRARTEAEAIEALGPPDPTVLIAGTAKQQTAPTTLAIPAMSAALITEGTPEGEAAVDAVTPAAGAATPSGTAGQPAAGVAGATDPAAAQGAALAAAATVQPASTPAQADAVAQTGATDAEQVDAASSSASAANGQTPSKASTKSVQTPAAQGAPAATATATNANAAAQVEVAVDAAGSLQQKAGAATEVAATATTTTQHTSSTASAGQAAHTAAPAATLQVYTRFVERFDGRAQRFEVRLDPAELGRIDVRIEVGADKKVHAVLAAHDSAALNDLMRGHRALERMLTDAGIDLADGGVKFEMVGDFSRNASSDKSESRPAAPNVWRSFDTIDIPLEAAATATSQPWRRTRLDLVA